jgi:hypothetical protein
MRLVLLEEMPVVNDGDGVKAKESAAAGNIKTRAAERNLIAAARAG